MRRTLVGYRFIRRINKQFAILASLATGDYAIFQADVFMTAISSERDATLFQIAREADKTKKRQYMGAHYPTFSLVYKMER